MNYKIKQGELMRIRRELRGSSLRMQYGIWLRSQKGGKRKSNQMWGYWWVLRIQERTKWEYCIDKKCVQKSRWINTLVWGEGKRWVGKIKYSFWYVQYSHKLKSCHLSLPLRCPSPSTPLPPLRTDHNTEHLRPEKYIRVCCFGFKNLLLAERWQNFCSPLYLQMTAKQERKRGFVTRMIGYEIT